MVEVVYTDMSTGEPREASAEASLPGVGTTLWAEANAWPLFAALVREYHEKINPVHNSDCYDYRSSRTSSAWSNHSSATAVDINADAEGATGSGPLSWWQQGKRAVRAARMKRKYEIVNWTGGAALGAGLGGGAGAALGRELSK